MKKLSILVTLGIITALILMVFVLLNRGEFKKPELKEKNLVFYKIEDYRKEAAEPSVSDSLKEKQQTKESKLVAAQGEIPSNYEMKPVEKEKSIYPPSKNGSKEISENIVLDEKKGKWLQLQKVTSEKNPGVVKKEQNMKEPRLWLYNAADDDTFWDIAEKYYGNGAYYPVLLEHNPHAGIYNIGRGVTLNILENKDNAGKLYKKIIIRKNGNFFWRYSVINGDTPQTIFKKYYKKGRIKSGIPTIAKNRKLKTGEKILILLE